MPRTDMTKLDPTAPEGETVHAIRYLRTHALGPDTVATEGQVHVVGRDVTKEEARRKVAMSYAEPCLATDKSTAHPEFAKSLTNRDEGAANRDPGKGADGGKGKNGDKGADGGK